ncbi:GTPase IMAP family member 8-like isoform X3 [Antennarius striatus]|uniref:GTPase IMAP family member 8-like isoform X3 n=1 Tax=Antennarius striatus TaxID=241820 RepID=UPI0035B328E6
MSALSRSTSMDFKRPPPSYPQPLTIALFGKSAELKNTIKNNIFKDNTPFVTLPNGLVMAKNESFRIFGLHLFDEDCNFPDQKIIDFMASSYPGPNMFILIIDLENIQKKEIYSEVYKHKTVFGEDLVRHLTVLLPDQNSFESLIHLKEQFTIGWATDKNLAEQCRKSCHGQQAYLFTYTNYSEDVVKRRRASLEKKSAADQSFGIRHPQITAKEREPGENPRRHGENIQTPHRAGVEPGTTLLCNDSAIHCTAVMPYGGHDKCTPHVKFSIVLLGITGTGKSESANTILIADNPYLNTNQLFTSHPSSMPVTTNCEFKITHKSFGEPVRVVDTPDFFHDQLQNNHEQVEKCRRYCQPGQCVVLLVMQRGRFTDKEHGILEKLEYKLGWSIRDSTIVLLTHGEDLEGTLEQYINSCDPLKSIVESCSNRCHVFRNKFRDRKQVIQLIKKIPSYEIIFPKFSKTSECVVV